MNKFFIRSLISVLIIFVVIDADAKDKKIKLGQSKWAITEEWLDQKLAEWAPLKSVKPLKWGGLLRMVSYGHINKDYPQEIIDSNLKLLEEMGVSIVSIHLNFDPWLKNKDSRIAMYDYIIGKIRSDGKKVLITDAAAEYYRKHRLSWDEFTKAFIKRVAVIAERYKPDYYIIIKEPGWYYPMISDVIKRRIYDRPELWVSLTQELAKTVKKVSPTTKVGIAVPADSIYHERYGLTTHREFIRGVAKIEGVDILGFDIYTRVSFEDTAKFITEENTAGKELWIAEAWSGTRKRILQGGAIRENLDMKWAKALYCFAQKYNISGAVIFFTDLLASYREAPQDAGRLLDFYKGRTKVFYELTEIIKD